MRYLQLWPTDYNNKHTEVIRSFNPLGMLLDLKGCCKPLWCTDTEYHARASIHYKEDVFFVLNRGPVPRFLFEVFPIQFAERRTDGCETVKTNTKIDVYATLPKHCISNSIYQLYASIVSDRFQESHKKKVYFTLEIKLIISHLRNVNFSLVSNLVGYIDLTNEWRDK